MLCYYIEVKLPDFRVEEAKRLSEGLQGFSLRRSLTLRAKGFLRPGGGAITLLE